MDELVYSETLGQWMTHSGIDIAAAKGTAVYAVWGGRVDRIYTDDALGVTVELDHGDGRISVYGNLDPDLPVEEGQRLRRWRNAARPPICTMSCMWTARPWTPWSMSC